MPTSLRHDLAILQRLVSEAIRLHRPRSVEEATMLADLRDYLMILTLDAYEDRSLAISLIDHFTRLQAWLETQLGRVKGDPHEGRVLGFYMGWLFALEQLLSLHHEIPLLPGEKISRKDFMRSWKRTAEKLRLE